MKRKRFTEEQIIGILKQAEAGGSNQEICRKNGITEQTFYRWRSKYGGMQVSDAKRLKELETEFWKAKESFLKCPVCAAVVRKCALGNSST